MNFPVVFLLIFFTGLIQIVFVSSESKFTFLDRSSSPDLSASSSFNYERASTKGSDASPQAKHFHKVKKLQKKLLLMCLFGEPTAKNGKIRRRARSVNVNGKFLYPSIIQQTDVNIGGSSEDDSFHDGLNTGGGGGSVAGHIGGFDCDTVLNLAPINHPLLGLLGGGAGGDNVGDTSDQTDNKMFYNRNINRHIIRPLYRSMRQFYNFYGSGFF